MGRPIETAVVTGLAALALLAQASSTILSLPANRSTTQPTSQATTQRAESDSTIPNETPRQKPRTCKIYDPADVKRYSTVTPVFNTVSTPRDDPINPDSPIYAGLTLSFDPTDTMRRDVYAIIDLRDVRIKHKDGTLEKADKYDFPIIGDTVRTLVRCGEDAEIDVYFTPEAVKEMDKHPFLKDKVKDIFKSPSLRRHYPEVGSREDNILKEGNPQDLLSKEPKRYIFAPPSFSTEKH
jgi:hypothetical protein